MYAIVDELGSLKLIGFCYGYLVLTMIVMASRWCPVNPKLEIGSFVCGFGGDRVLILRSV